MTLLEKFKDRKVVIFLGKEYFHVGYIIDEDADFITLRTDRKGDVIIRKDKIVNAREWL